MMSFPRSERLPRKMRPIASTASLCGGARNQVMDVSGADARCHPTARAHTRKISCRPR